MRTLFNRPKNWGDTRCIDRYGHNYYSFDPLEGYNFDFCVRCKKCGSEVKIIL